MIVVVPARGGSKGLPGKNTRLLDGLPLIVHTLQTALAADAVSRVLVSTEDDEIIRVSRTVEGVEIPFRRPPHLATDDAHAADAYIHLVDSLALMEGQRPEAICVLLPTAPLRLASDIDKAIALYREKAATAVISVTGTKPLSWTMEMATDNRLTAATDDNEMRNRQEHADVYVPNGSIYVLDAETLRRTRTYLGPKCFGYPMPADRSVDIDTEADFRMAEALLTKRYYDAKDRDLRHAV